LAKCFSWKLAAHTAISSAARVPNSAVRDSSEMMTSFFEIRTRCRCGTMALAVVELEFVARRGALPPADRG
jgi:hypothetical protein